MVYEPSYVVGVERSEGDDDGYPMRHHVRHSYASMATLFSVRVEDKIPYPKRKELVL
jgi:hypothetical protein